MKRSQRLHPHAPDRCPVCGGRSSCIESRPGPTWTRRRYACQECRQRWTTREVVVHVDAGDEPRRGERDVERSIWA